MASNESYLSNEKYGYDFVVATTQASINAGLKEYLTNIAQPETKLGFLADEKGNPTIQANLEQIIKETGVDPFSIPNGTDTNDPRIQKLGAKRLQVALKMKLGLPEHIMPRHLPPIIDLESSANNVLFNLMCSELVIIQYTPGGGWASRGTWSVWSQGHKPWYFTTRVDLVYEDLDKELENSPYFRKNPQKKQTLLNQLNNLGSGAFSLQQLLFDLDNAATMSIPQIEGLDPSSDAGIMLQKSFVNTYFNAVKNEGRPVLAVHAIANTDDGATFRLTGIERGVNPFLDGNGAVAKNPTPEQKEATTLNYLCAVNNKKLPGVASFEWNWMDPKDIGDHSGIIAINRNTLAEYFKDQLMAVVPKSCIKVECWTSAEAMGDATYSWRLTTGQEPAYTVTSPDSGDGSQVLSIDYQDHCKGRDKSGATVAEMELRSTYNCSVFFEGNTVKIVQNLKIWLYVEWDATSEDGNIFDTAITDIYTLSIDQNGAIQMTQAKPVTTDNAKDFGRSSIVNWFTNINDLKDDIKNKVDHFAATQISDIPVGDLRNFVFPGGNVFTFKDVKFSAHQDLIAEVTYVSPK